MTLHAKTFAARAREAEQKRTDERIAAMTIPEQAVEAAASAIRSYCASAEVKSEGEHTPDPMVYALGYARAALNAALPLLGVQRTEDVDDGTILKLLYASGLGEKSVRLTYTIIGALKQTAGYLERWADEPECGYFYGLVVDAISRASQSPAPQAGCAKEGASAELLKGAFEHFQWNDCYPGDWWCFTEDGTELCLEYAERGANFHIDLHRDGTVTLLWRPSKGAKAEIVTLTSASPPPPVAESAPPIPFPIDWTNHGNVPLVAEQETEAK